MHFLSMYKSDMETDEIQTWEGQYFIPVESLQIQVMKSGRDTTLPTKTSKRSLKRDTTTPTKTPKRSLTSHTIPPTKTPKRSHKSDITLPTKTPKRSVTSDTTPPTKTPKRKRTIQQKVEEVLNMNEEEEEKEENQEEDFWNNGTSGICADNNPDGSSNNKPNASSNNHQQLFANNDTNDFFFGQASQNTKSQPVYLVCQYCHLMFFNSLENLMTIRQHCKHCDVAPRPDSQHNFVCIICKFHTHHHKSITDHIRMHQGFKPFECSDCNYRSAYAQDLRRHKKIVHEK